METWHYPAMDDYERIARVIQVLDEERLTQPDLAGLARHAGLSPHHFHRLFSRWAGVTPKDFLQALTLEHARRCLREGSSVLDSALDSGLSGPGRLHDLCVSMEAATPGEIKSGGAGWVLEAGFADSPFGTCLIAQSARGICHLSYVEQDDMESSWGELQAEWPNARLQRKDKAARDIASKVFQTHAPAPHQPPLRALVKGTAFQVRVWRALLRIPTGRMVSYGQLAAFIGTPAASRAVGSAIGSNALAYLIPCHRVIRSTGIVSDYRWGATRKRATLAWEAAAG